ncbi:hypothetical protein Ddye_009403 [Dipteronia dyeriana]|uniref:Protein phosphatase n=1 Tax=Dipteronia dyeriana TaxID=168575 RepID=A0AAE0CM98_9ROSI|nr:hypothetical protein Ddye_009403 [Dipteronia dyeriana]
MEKKKRPADGVGAWIKKGIDSGEYSRQLMSNSLVALNQETRGHVDPILVLEDAYYKTKSQGSSTACIIARGNVLFIFRTLIALDDRHHCLNVANVGDSGFVVFRNRECIYQSPIQPHGFNHPYQLGCSSQFGDAVDTAMEIVVPVQSGDIVVASTDGLIDNTFPSEIEKILTKRLDRDDHQLPKTWHGPQQSMHCTILSTDYESPFSRAAHLAGKNHVGGKIDDITVVVAKII